MASSARAVPAVAQEPQGDCERDGEEDEEDVRSKVRSKSSGSGKTVVGRPRRRPFARSLSSEVVGSLSTPHFLKGRRHGEDHNERSFAPDPRQKEGGGSTWKGRKGLKSSSLSLSSKPDGEVETRMAIKAKSKAASAAAGEPPAKKAK